MECLNCKKPVEQTEGKREKLYCSDSCRVEYYRAKSSEGKPKRGRGRPKKDKIERLDEEVAAEKERRSNALINAARGCDPDGVNKDEAVLSIKEQIAEIRAEKIPSHRNTSLLGRKSWAIEQKKRIEELEKQLANHASN